MDAQLRQRGKGWFSTERIWEGFGELQEDPGLSSTVLASLDTREGWDRMGKRRCSVQQEETENQWSCFLSCLLFGMKGG